MCLCNCKIWCNHSLQRLKGVPSHLSPLSPSTSPPSTAGYALFLIDWCWRLLFEVGETVVSILEVGDAYNCYADTIQEEEIWDIYQGVVLWMGGVTKIKKWRWRSALSQVWGPLHRDLTLHGSWIYCFYIARSTHPFLLNSSCTPWDSMHPWELAF